jgi:hypothetical protein
MAVVVITDEAKATARRALTLMSKALKPIEARSKASSHCYQPASMADLTLFSGRSLPCPAFSSRASS